MAAITAETPKGPYAAAALGANVGELTWTAGDTGGDTIAFSKPRLLLLVRNSSADTDYYLTVTGQATRLGPANAIISTHDIAFGETFAYLFEREGWADSSGNLNIVVENAALLVAALHLP